jgi:hypothetical protein
VGQVLADAAKRIGRVLKARGVLEGEDTPGWMLEEEGLVQCCEGSLRGVSTFGGRAGEKARALGRVRQAHWQPMRGRLCAEADISTSLMELGHG